MVYLHQNFRHYSRQSLQYKQTSAEVLLNRYSPTPML